MLGANDVVALAGTSSFVDLVFAALPFELFNALPALLELVLLAAVASGVAGLSAAGLAAASVAAGSVGVPSAGAVVAPPVSPAAIEVSMLMSFFSNSAMPVAPPPAPAIFIRRERSVLISKAGAVAPFAPVAPGNADAPPDFPNAAVKADSTLCTDVSPPVAGAAVAAFPPVNALNAAVSWATTPSPAAAGDVLADFSNASKFGAPVVEPPEAAVNDFWNAARLAVSAGLVVDGISPARLAELGLVTFATVICGIPYMGCWSRHRSTNADLL